MSSSSELIYNKDGTIYHLNIDESFLNEYIITVGDPERVDVVASHCDSVIKTATKREFTTAVCQLGNKRITVISTGIGTDNIDIVLNEIHALYCSHKKSYNGELPSLNFIRIGTSGGIHPDTEVDSVIVNNASVGLDLLMHYYNSTEPGSEQEKMKEIRDLLNLPINPYYFEADRQLVRAFLNLPKSAKGIGLTASGFYGPQGRDIHKIAKYPRFPEKLKEFRVNGNRLTNLEMETAAIYGLSSAFGHKAVSINAIIANRLTDSFSDDYKDFTSNVIKDSLNIIKGL